jgi:SNF2 family DNA or RNA helicase
MPNLSLVTAAHHVWLLDYWWAAAPESQAIDR